MDSDELYQLARVDPLLRRYLFAVMPSDKFIQLDRLPNRLPVAIILNNKP